MSANYASRSHETSEENKENKKGNTDCVFSLSALKVTSQ